MKRLACLVSAMVASILTGAFADSPAGLPALEQGQQWKLVWNDDFDGATIDASKWEVMGDWKRRDGFWVKDDASLDGKGHLVLRTKKDGDRYTCGAIRTLGHYDHRFGYYEARCKFHTQPGHWPAFWLVSTEDVCRVGDGGRDGTEIDIMEKAWRDARVQHALHWDGYGKDHKTEGKVVEVQGIMEGFHTFGLWWKPDGYIFYVDGKETWRTVAGGVCQVPVYIKLTEEIGDWAGKIADAKLPDTFLVDYVRVYDVVGDKPKYNEALLYNGIVLPEVWPPKDRAVSREPMDVPYLKTPPARIHIDTGRQLFVDDFLIEKTTLDRKYHKAEWWPENPVLRPDKPWESTREDPTAMPFSDGVWYDPQDNLFKMWYMAGFCAGTAYAVSKDGIHWDKPELDVFPGTNLVQKIGRDSSTVWLDLNEKDPAKRYRMLTFLQPASSGALSLFLSSDGIHWGEPVAKSGPCGDRTTVFFNPFRNRWVYSIRAYDPKTIGRYRKYWEGGDILKGLAWKPEEPVFWVGADIHDPVRDDLKTFCELYNLDAVGYESILLGFFDIWRGQPKDRAKPNEVCLGFSRDGFHCYRPDREAFMGVSERQGNWNWANVQSAGGGCLVVGDKLYFYVSGRKGVPGSSTSGECATGLATLRRDGFASMDAGDSEGTLVTRPVTFSGKFLFVNARTNHGELRVEVLGMDEKPIPPFTLDNCAPVSVDKTRERIRWNGAEDLSSVAGKSVRFRFVLRKGALYSFWVSPKESGASMGYVAAGGPGLNGSRDNQ